MEGKAVAIDIDVVDVPLDYNLLLGRNRIYNMQAVASSLFRVVCFPLDGKVVTVDQISFDNSSSKASSRGSIPIIDHSQLTTENIGVGMYPSLMGNFSCVAPVLMIGSSLGKTSTLSSSVPFRTSHMEDPWTLPSLSNLSEVSIPVEMDMPLSTTMVAYQANIDLVIDSSTSSSWTEEQDPYAFPS